VNQPMLLFLLTAAGLIGLGLYGLLAYPQPLRKVLAANVMISGVFLVFIALGRRSPPVTDPVPQAMVLTGIVIAVSTTALALVIIKRLYREDRPPDASASPPDAAAVVDS